MENIITPSPINGELNESASPIIDRFGRTFNYLRLALNEQCNLRCIYCMPEEGIEFRPEDKLLSTEEIFRLIELASQMGVSKIRLTGGEPLLRKDLVPIIQFANSLDGIDSIHVTTNGLLLSKYFTISGKKFAFSQDPIVL